MSDDLTIVLQLLAAFVLLEIGVVLLRVGYLLMRTPQHEWDKTYLEERRKLGFLRMMRGKQP